MNIVKGAGKIQDLMSENLKETTDHHQNTLNKKISLALRNCENDENAHHHTSSISSVDSHDDPTHQMDKKSATASKAITSKVQKKKNQKVLNSQIQDAMRRNKATDIFNDIKKKADTQLTVDEIANSHVHYKFKRCNLLREKERLKLLLKLNMASGPVYIICLIRII